MAHSGWHIALIGQNGSGKSSLFALLRNALSPDSGSIQLPNQSAIAHMAQEVEALDRIALDYVLDGDTQLRGLQSRLAQAEDQHDSLAIAKLHQDLADVDAYTAESRAAKLLAGLGFQQSDFQKTVKEFSGGWRMRLNLAQTLMKPSQIMLLDEPTNHLDLDAILWLEQWLRGYPGMLILISHDREFIDATVDHVIQIEHQSLNYYSGNYSSYEKQKAARLANQQSAFEKQQREITHLQSFIDRFKAKASKAKQAQSRVKALEKMEQIAPAHIDSPFSFTIQASDKISTPLLDLNKADLGYAESAVLKSVSLQLMPAMRIGLIGPNGAGKSTLIKTLANEIAPLKGTRQYGEHCYIGYFAQHQLDQLDAQSTPLVTLQRLAPSTDEQTLRKYLGSFGFHGDAVHDNIGRFSGGEKARLSLALIIWRKPNLLLLDEPTNHLDLEMRLALTLALQEYSGALVVVSHDRHLLRSTTDEFYLVANGQVAVFDGDLDDYSAWLKDYRQNQNGDDNNNNSELAKKDKKLERQYAAERRAKIAPLKNKIKKLEAKLETLETTKQTLAAQLSDPSAYEEENKHRLKQWLSEQQLNSQQIDEVEAEWLEASEQLQEWEG